MNDKTEMSIKNFFSRHFISLTVLILSTIGFFNLVLPINNFFSENSSFYFLSSLLQANAAILSITGVFYIFKIQSIQSSIDIIKSNLMSDLGRRSWPEQILEFDKFTLDQKESNLNSDRVPKAIRLSLEDWTSKERYIHNLKKEIRTPFVLLGIGIFFEAIFLFTAHFFHTYYNVLEYYILYINLLLELLIITVIIKSIFKSLE